MNALLQALFHIEALREAVVLLATPHAPPSSDPLPLDVLAEAGTASAGSRRDDQGGFCHQRGIARALADVFLALRDGPDNGSDKDPSGGPARTAGLCFALCVDVRLQEDPHEFKGRLLSALQDDLAAGSQAAGSLARGGGAFAALEAPFRGALVNTIAEDEGGGKGGKGAGFSRRWREPFLELALDVNGTGSVEAALDKYFGDEVFEEHPELGAAYDGVGRGRERGGADFAFNRTLAQRTLLFLSLVANSKLLPTGPLRALFRSLRAPTRSGLVAWGCCAGRSRASPSRSVPR